MNKRRIGLLTYYSITTVLGSSACRSALALVNFSYLRQNIYFLFLDFRSGLVFNVAACHNPDVLTFWNDNLLKCVA